MSIFDKKESLSRQELRSKLEKASPKIPGSNKEYSRAERIKMEEEVFGKNFGGLVTKSEFKSRFLKMREAKFRAKTGDEKIKLDRKMRYLKKLSNIDV